MLCFDTALNIVNEGIRNLLAFVLMWLLSTESSLPELVEFNGDFTEPYAILSHTWGPHEVLFRDIGHDDVVSKTGYKKICYCLDQARKDGYEYLWVDTCCIDKSSSAELSEAINSMYYWYQQAGVCHTYLVDVTDLSELQQSRWFTRGWTLQELIAPNNVIFFTQDWVMLGNKFGLSETISTITGIDQSILEGEASLNFASVAKRMSWAAKRETSRIEDMAYCLLGIFGVNMPLLYGERTKAFIRLQEEICKTTDDQTLFVWKDPEAHPEEARGMLATSPRFFEHSAAAVPRIDMESTAPVSISNGCLNIEVRLRPADDGADSHMAMLNCSLSSQDPRSVVVNMKQTSRKRNEYARTDCCTLRLATLHGNLTLISVPQARAEMSGITTYPDTRYIFALREIFILESCNVRTITVSHSKIVAREVTDEYDFSAAFNTHQTRDTILKCYECKLSEEREAVSIHLTIGMQYQQRQHAGLFSGKPVTKVHACSIRLGAIEAVATDESNSADQSEVLCDIVDGIPPYHLEQFLPSRCSKNVAVRTFRFLNVECRVSPGVVYRKTRPVACHMVDIVVKPNGGNASQ